MKQMGPLSCKKAKKISDGFFQETLPPDLARRLEAHLSACSFCRQEIRENQKILALLQADRLPDPGPELWDGLNSKIMTQVRQIQGVPKRRAWSGPSWSGPFQWPGYAWATVLILIVLTPLVIYTAYNYNGRSSQIIREFSEQDLRTETAFDSLPSLLESLSPKETARLGKKIAVQMGKALSSAHNSLLTDEDFQWDVHASLEDLTTQELKALTKKLPTGIPAGFKEGEKYVS
jgi:hypothetical protein